MNVVSQTSSASSRPGFRLQLLIGVTVGILALTLIVSVTTSWVTNSRVSQQTTAQGLKVVETLASQSVLALIYASPQNAKVPLQAILNFPDVVYAVILGTDQKPLHSVGKVVPEVMTEISFNHDIPELVHETDDYWHFVAPVMTGGMVSTLENDGIQALYSEPNPEFLGFAYIVMDKTTLRNLQFSVFLSNISIAFAIALVLIFLLNLGINRLIRPLFQLVGVMEHNEKEGERVHAVVSGPKEIIRLAEGFNSMMSSLEEKDRKLRRYSEMLEVEIELRTRELVEARDAALTASRHKSEFLANITHELRTPLQAIIGYAELSREELELLDMDDEVAHLELVVKNAKRLLALINSILNLSKLDAGRMELKFDNVNLESLVDEAVRTVVPLMSYSNNKLESHCSAVNSEVVIDREKILQSILNLLSNAAKFTRDGKVILNVKLTESELNISVADTGIGLSEDQQKIIFDEFRQVDGSTTRSFEGTGLGLSITKGFCELMGGTISVESIMGKGSTFKIQIPMPMADKVTPIQQRGFIKKTDRRVTFY